MHACSEDREGERKGRKFSSAIQKGKKKGREENNEGVRQVSRHKSEGI